MNNNIVISFRIDSEIQSYINYLKKNKIRHAHIIRESVRKNVSNLILNKKKYIYLFKKTAMAINKKKAKINRIRIGKDLERLRKEKNISKIKLCNDAGISRTQYNNIAKGKTDFYVSTLQAILSVLEIKLTDFFNKKK